MNSQLNIVVVEDHDGLREVTVEALRNAGHRVIGIDSAEALAEDRHMVKIDLMIIDLNLPGEDGISLTRRLRQSQPNMGIIIVTARGLLAEKIEGYQSGADIYLTKPASVEELCAAISALGRRLIPIDTNALKLNPRNLTVSGNQGEVALTSYEAALLNTFTGAPQQQIENSQLIKLLGKEEDEYSKASLEVQIVRLRKKIARAGVNGQSIKSIRNFGYQLCVRLEVV